MKYLITRSSSAAAAPSLRRCLDFQKLHPIQLDHREVVVSDSEIPNLHCELIVDPALSGDGGYWHGRVRNLILELARRSDADYLIALDSDAVFLGFGDGGPVGDFERTNVFYQRDGEIITPEAMQDESRWLRTSWWVYSRRMFMQPWCRSHEGFIGYGWDDFDFLHNVAIPNGTHLVNSNGRLIHLWHPPKRNVDNAVFDLEFLRNKRLYETRRRDIEKRGSVF